MAAGGRRYCSAGNEGADGFHCSTEGDDYSEKWLTAISLMISGKGREVLGGDESDCDESDAVSSGQWLYTNT